MFNQAIHPRVSASAADRRHFGALETRALATRVLALMCLAVAAVGSTPLLAQQRLLLPEGTVLTVQTESSLSSQSAHVGQLFTTTVTDSVRVEGFTVIPEGSRIEGEVTLARAATSRESGLIGVEFTRLVFPNGQAIGIDGKLTSTDPAERRQIEAQGDARVVFVGGRRGVGAAIGSIGSGSAADPVSGVLGALGSLLSKGADVTVPARTALAVQLERGIALNVVGLPARRPDAFTIYTSAEMIRAAQSALRDAEYYQGPLDGRLSEETQRALFEFQIDNGILATGNLDGRTAQALDLSTRGGAVGLTPAEAALVRRNAQLLAGRWREQLAVTTAGRLDPRRTYRPNELELYFALSAFADNARLYDQIVRVSGNSDGIVAASAALIGAARRVDAALMNVSAPARIAVDWEAIQSDLSSLDPAYPR